MRVQARRAAGVTIHPRGQFAPDDAWRAGSSPLVALVGNSHANRPVRATNARWEQGGGVPDESRPNLGRHQDSTAKSKKACKSLDSQAFDWWVVQGLNL